MLVSAHSCDASTTASAHDSVAQPLLPSRVPVTWWVGISVPSWFLRKVHINTGRLCSGGSYCHVLPHRHRSYSALRLPSARRPWLRFPLPSAYLVEGVSFFTNLHVHPQNIKTLGVSVAGLRGPLLSRGNARVSQVTGPSSSYVPWPSTSPTVPSPSPSRGDGPAAFRPFETLGCAGIVLSMAVSPWPTRSPAYASTPPLPMTLQGWLPACRAQL